MHTRAGIVSLAVFLAVSPAFADDAADPVDSAADVSAAPKPADASGFETPPDGPQKGGIWIGRVLFFAPKWATRIALAPVRGLIYIYYRYAIDLRFKSIFFSEDGTIGLFPTVSLESGFGFSFGAKLLHKSLFGMNERFQIGGQFQGRFNQTVTTSLHSGDRLNPFFASAFLQYNRGLQARFFGIGNGDPVLGSERPDRVNPLIDDTAISTRYEFDELLARMSGAYSPLPFIRFRLLQELRLRDYPDERNDTTDDSILIEYDSAGLVGFIEGLSQSYTQLTVELDGRRVRSPYISRATPSSGGFSKLFVGMAKGWGNDPTDFVRYGGVGEVFVDLYAGDRVLALRAYFEGVTGTLNEVPFDLLPALGGPTILRGYQRDRFRERYVALGSLQYSFPATPNFAGYLFVDTGKPFASLEAFNLKKFRTGYGAGIQFHGKQDLVFRLEGASSSDGGFFFNFVFEPVLNVNR